MKRNGPTGGDANGMPYQAVNESLRYSLPSCFPLKHPFLVVHTMFWRSVRRNLDSGIVALMEGMLKKRTSTRRHLKGHILTDTSLLRKSRELLKEKVDRGTQFIDLHQIMDIICVNIILCFRDIFN